MEYGCRGSTVFLAAPTLIVVVPGVDMDVKDMKIFADGDFDAVIDKGCIDCVLVI